MTIIKREIPSWDKYFFNILEVVKTRSPDAQTQVACIFTKNNKILGCGYNGFPSGLDGLDDTRPLKYKWMLHAEQNTLANTNKKKKNMTAYLTHLPCNICLKEMWQAGVRTIKVPPNRKVFTYTEDDWEVLTKMLYETSLEFQVGNKKILSTQDDGDMKGLKFTFDSDKIDYIKKQLLNISP